MSKPFDIKCLFLCGFLCIAVNLPAQFTTPVSVSIAYFGEMISHPGLKIGLNFRMKSWTDGQDVESLYISLSVGSFFHRRYQTGIFALPELNYGKQYASGNTISTGIGFGVLHAIVPGTYELNQATGEFIRARAVHNYLAPGISLSFGKGNAEKEYPSNLFLKPQFMYAFPNFPRGVGYFGLELGSTINLLRDE